MTLRRFSCEISSSWFDFQLPVKRGMVACNAIPNVWHRRGFRRHGLCSSVVYAFFPFFELCYFRGWSPAVPVCFFIVLPKSLWACRFALGELRWRGGIRGASPGYPLLYLHLDGKTDTAACSDIIAHSGSVVGLTS